MNEDSIYRLQNFVRSTLGCGCDDEFLRSIRCTRTGPGIDSPLTRLDVGGRLLIYVLTVDDDPRPAILALPAVIASGVVERDTEGFNRLRVVVATENPEELRERAEEVFAASAPMDDRIHLHVIEVSDLPFND